MKSERLFIFDWPKEELEFIKDYCASFDLKDAEYVNDVPIDCKTAEECIDINHWSFDAADQNVSLDGKYYSFSNNKGEDTPREAGLPIHSLVPAHSDDFDEKFEELVSTMARKNIEEFKDSENILVRRAAFYLYDVDNFMGWHTNSASPAWRIYLTYTEEPNKSYICHFDEETQKVVKSYDKEGITCRAFNLKDYPPLKHSVLSQTKRWSIGFRIFDGDKCSYCGSKIK